MNSPSSTACTLPANPPFPMNTKSPDQVFGNPSSKSTVLVWPSLLVAIVALDVAIGHRRGHDRSRRNRGARWCGVLDRRQDRTRIAGEHRGRRPCDQEAGKRDSRPPAVHEAGSLHERFPWHVSSQLGYRTVTKARQSYESVTEAQAAKFRNEKVEMTNPARVRPQSGDAGKPKTDARVEEGRDSGAGAYLNQP